MNDKTWCSRCHDVEAVSKGMCRSCYHLDWRMRKRGENPDLDSPKRVSSRIVGRPKGAALNPKFNGASCKAHSGEFDLDLMIPLGKSGKPYLPGIRLCGTLDCIVRKHIDTYNPGLVAHDHAD